MSAIDDLRQTMARLRSPSGCPWDQEQTHRSLARCLIDECSELLETIDQNDLPHMREELGDVLIQVVFHALLAEEAGAFNFDDVARDINDKLIRRHPHVFGPERLQTSTQVITRWDEIKAQERARAGLPATPATVFKSLPPRLPSLMFAEAVWKQVKKKNLPAAEAIDLESVEALREGMDEAALGRLLFEIVAAANAGGLDPEGALRRHTDQVMRTIEHKVQLT